MSPKKPLEIHALANQFPPMSDLEYAALKADIAENGLTEPIVLFEGKILDGRNRYRACVELGKDFETTKFKGSYEQAAKLSASANLTRRHLSKSQKALIIAANGLAKAPSSDEDKATIRDAARRYGVNHMTIYKAFYVYGRDRELAEEVLKGKISVGRAESRLRLDENPGKEARARSAKGNDLESVLARLEIKVKDCVDELVRKKVLRYLELSLRAIESATGDQVEKCL